MEFKKTDVKQIIADRKIIVAGDLFLVKPVSVHFITKVAQGLPHKVPRNPALLAVAFSLTAKNLRRAGGGVHEPPVSGQGLKNRDLYFEQLSSLKSNIFPTRNLRLF